MAVIQPRTKIFHNPTDQFVLKALENSHRYQAIIRSAEDAIISKTLNGQVTSWNHAAEKLYGYTAQEMIGKKITKLIPRKNLQGFRHIMRRLRKGEKIEHYETERRKKDGSPVMVSISISPIRNERGKIIGASTITRDITEQIKIKHELQVLSSYVQLTTDAIWGKDRRGNITSWNNGAVKLYGYQADEIMGKNLNVIVPKNKREELKVLDKKLWHGIQVPALETERLAKAGHIINTSISFAPVRNGNHRVTSIVSIARDISLQKKTEEQLVRSEERFRTLIEQSADAIQLIGADGRIKYSSDTVKKVTGYRPEELQGQGAEPFIHPDDIKKFYQAFAYLLEKPGNQATLEYRIKHKNGQWVWVEATGVNHLDNPVIQAVVGNFRNIEMRKRLEKQKDDFLSIASHELKTPVTSLKAFAQVLESQFRNAGNDKAANLLGKMDAQINRLTTLIQDLLDVSKLGAGRLPFNEDYFRFDDMVRETVEELQRTTNDNKIYVRGRTNKRVYGDRERLGQVLTNFLTNAIKYSKFQGKINVYLNKDKEQVSCRVQDFGVGIPSRHLPHIFERFYRVTGKTHDTVPGMGLGLYISSEIIRREKGKIWAESKLGKGSDFYFTLPLHRRAK